MIKDMISVKGINGVIKFRFDSGIFNKDDMIDLVGVANWVSGDVLLLNALNYVSDVDDLQLSNQYGIAKCITLVNGSGTEYLYDIDTNEFTSVELSKGDSLYIPPHLYHTFSPIKCSVISTMSTDYNNPDKELFIALKDIKCLKDK